jgi:hypothetical protein
MARNRKVQAAVLRFGPMIKAALICLLIGGAGVGYVGQKQSIIRLSKEQEELEKRLGRLVENGRALRKQLETMESHPELELQVRRLNLGLAAPSPHQIIKLAEWSGETEWPRTERLYANGTIRPDQRR